MKKQSITSHIFWGTLIVGIGVGVAFLASEAVTSASAHLKKIEKETISAQPAEEQDNNDASLVIQPKEKESYYIVGEASLPDINASSYLVADLATGQVILAKENEAQRPIASITKLMTAIVALERLPVEEYTQISQTAIATEGFRGNLRAGQEVSIKELISPLLLTSSNDAAEAIAEAQDRDTFIADMNAKADALGMWKSTYNDASGLSSLNQSTANDLFLMMQYITEEHPYIWKVARSNHYMGEKQTWDNINRLRTEPTFYGGKTGYTNAARQTGAGVYHIPLSGEERELAIIVLKSDARERDIRSIINYLQKYVHYGDEASVQKLIQSNS